MISVPPKGDSDKRIGAHFGPLQVEAQSTPDMTVQIRAGSFWTALGNHQEYPGGNTAPISAPATDAKWVVVTINEDGLINLYDGTPSGDPDLPNMPENVLPLAGIFVGDTTTAITSSMVFDLRPLWQVRPEHIPNLAAELASRPTLVDVNSLLALKADMNGTVDPIFTFNKDEVGVPGVDIEFVVERGSEPNVSIAWRETTNQWEFTNDGVTWAPIGAAAGTYYTTAQLDSGQLNSLYYTQTQLDTGVLDSRYYNQTIADSTFAQITHAHLSTDITDFATAAAGTAPVQDIAGKTGNVVLVEADITDLDKYDTVTGAVVGNLVSFGATNLVDTGIAATGVTLVGHSHVAADVTDFTLEVNTLISTASINDLSDVVSATPLEGHVQVYNSTSSWYNNRFLNVGELGDVVDVTPVLNDALLFNGVAYANRPIVKADVSDYVEGDYVHKTGSLAETVDGVKTFSDDMIVQGSLTVQGTEAVLETSELRIQDKFFDVNWGETGAGVGGVATPQDAGMRVKRGTENDALFYWDESSDTWIAGVVGNVGQVVIGNHTHISAEIVDFSPRVTTELNINDLDEIQDVNYPAPIVAGQVLYWNAGNWEPTTLVAADVSDFAAQVTLELSANALDEIMDVVYPAAPILNQALLWAGTRWENRAIVKNDVSDFVEADYVHVTGTETVNGDKTFGNDIIIVGDLTVQGTTTTVNSTVLEITDNVIVVNNGETGAGVSGGNAGMRADRGTLDDAVLVWDELNLQWEAGTIGATTGISLIGHTHVIADIPSLGVSAAEINQLTGVKLTETVQQQLDESLRRDLSEAMDPSFNLSFSAGGEVLGLPPIPTVDDAAASKKYVDDQDAAVSLVLTTHISDDTRHVTADQNAFLDGLTLPTLTSTEVNYLIGVTSGVQAQIDSKTNLTIPATVNDIALLDVVGDLVDSGYRRDDLGVTVNDLWSAVKIQTELDLKADKVLAVAPGAPFVIITADNTPPFPLKDFFKVTGDQTATFIPGSTVIVSGFTGAASANNGTYTVYASSYSLPDTKIEVNEVIASSSLIGSPVVQIAGGIGVGNFMSIDPTGNIADSGYNAASFTLMGHLHDTADITTGTFVDARIAVTNVTQHETSIDHNVLTNYTITEHRTINDIAVGATDLWSAQKITAELILKSDVGHTHLHTDITDFDTEVDALIAAYSGPVALVLDDLADVVDSGASSGDFLRHNGVTYTNVNASLITDFVRTASGPAQTVPNDITFGQDVTVTGDLIVNGTTTTVSSTQVDIGDAVLRLNANLAPTSPPSVDAGFEINRGNAGDDSQILWNETNDEWTAGTVSDMRRIARETETIAQPYYEAVETTIVTATYIFTTTVAVPASGKVAVQVFVNGIKYREGPTKQYIISSHAPITVVFNAGFEPPIGADVEIYAFGEIG